MFIHCKNVARIAKRGKRRLQGKVKKTEKKKKIIIISHIKAKTTGLTNSKVWPERFALFLKQSSPYYPEFVQN